MTKTGFRVFVACPPWVGAGGAWSRPMDVCNEAEVQTDNAQPPNPVHFFFCESKTLIAACYVKELGGRRREDRADLKPCPVCGRANRPA